MARLATAAAGLAWAAILLMCAALVAGQGTGAKSLLLKDTQPEPVRIYCLKDPASNIAVRDGEVVLATATCSDLSQKWFMHVSPSAAAASGPMPFSLENAKTGQVIKIPSGNGQVGLTSITNVLDTTRAIREELWTAKEPTRPDRFSPLFVNKDQNFTLRAQQTKRGIIGDGSLIRISKFGSATSSDNALWQITSYPLCT